MKITFYSNYLTHHQTPFCNEMYHLLKNDFTFVSTENMDIERMRSGWDDQEGYKYEIKSFESKEVFEKALYLSKDSDVIIHGSAPELFIKERMQHQSAGISLRYSERIYKKGRWRALSPRGIVKRIGTYHRYYKKNLYMLCASAYTSGDLMLQGAYIGKCYKWGYFPKTFTYNLDSLINLKKKNKVNILWCGRLIEWKHPEMAIELAVRLKQNGFDFNLNIIGNGTDEDKINKMVIDNKLQDCVHMYGVVPQNNVRQHMKESNIFICTSDFNEGWGAVINEAMNSGCAVVASHAIGSVPYLIEDRINGLVYDNGDISSIYDKVKLLIDDNELCERLGRKAYETILNEWNANTAAERLLLLVEDLNKKGFSDRFKSGPCSKAEIIKNNWYRNYIK